MSKPVDTTWYYAQAWPDGRVEVRSVTLRDTGAKTLAVVGGDPFLVRHAKRVNREDVERGEGRFPGAGYGLRPTRRLAILAALERSDAALERLEEWRRATHEERSALWKQLEGERGVPA